MSALSQKNIRAMSALPPIAYGAGVIAYGVRVSAYGISHKWLHRPRKRFAIKIKRSNQRADTGLPANILGPYFELLMIFSTARGTEPVP
jgi:hypothetical protein